MKKICFVIPRAYYLFNPKIKGAEDKVGGAQKQSFILSTESAKDTDFDVHFCVADFGQKEFEEHKGVKLWKSFNFSDNIFKRIRDLIRMLKMINADLYIFRSADAGVAFAIYYIKLLLKKRVLYMIAADAETSEKRQRKYSGFFTSIAMKRAYKKVDTISAQTQQQSDSFEKHRKRKPDAIIGNIYLSENTETIDHSERRSILWVGRLNKIKNPRIFTDLAKKYPNEQFIMIAPIVRDHIEFGRQIHKEANETDNLRLIDYVSPDKINSYYNRAKIYVLSSELEGFSNTMAEAMISKCPILSYNVNPDNILNKFNCGFCANADIELFRQYFEKLNDDLELRKLSGKNGAEYIFENHQKEKIIKKFKDLL